MSPILRFAPSPTGHLHFGNVRTAVLNYLYARQQDGQFILRLDDTDRERSTDAYADGIRADLRWLGFTWEREERQSDRTARYLEVADQLKASRRLYPCYESADELDRRRKRQMAMGRPPIYDRAALKLSAEQCAAFEAEGRTPHWRFRLANSGAGPALEPKPTPVVWEDLIRGTQSVDLGSLSDPVLIREDGTFLYTFTSVVDDADFAITQIIRGEDHVTNSGVQIDLFKAIGATPPQMAHHALLSVAGDLKMSKRTGDMALSSYKMLEPMAVLSYCALIGTPGAIEPVRSIAELARRLDLSSISTAAAKFDIEELKALNAKYLHETPFGEVADRLKAAGIGGGEAFWTTVRGNLGIFDDVKTWWTVVNDAIKPVIEDAAFTVAAAKLLPAEPWDDKTWSAWTDAVKKETGAKGRGLFHPLRLALTGHESGPELKMLLPFIGKTRAEARLSGATA